MGGSIMVGVRRSDGREQCSIRWTNSMPLWLADPNFQDEGSALEQFWAMAKPAVRGLDVRMYDVLHPAIQRVSYGLILVDFKTKSVLSRNGYSSVGYLNVAHFSSAFLDELRIVRDLHRAGRVGTIYHGAYANPATELSAAARQKYLQEIEHLFETVQTALHALAGKIEVPMFVAELHHVTYSWPTGFTVSNGMESEREEWKRVKAWVRERGWSTPVRDRKG